MRLRTTLFVAVILLSLSSCLKSEDKYGFNSDPGTVVSEIFDVNTSGSEKVIILDATPPVETFTAVTLKVYSPRSKSGNVHVTLTVADAAGYTRLPASAYTMPLEYDVSKQTGEIDVKMTLNKNALNLANSYGLTLKIAAVSDGVISEHTREIAIALIVKNKYDGKYNITWTNYHPSANTTYSGSSTSIEMHTSGGNSAKMWWPLANNGTGAYCAPAWLNGGLSYFGAQEPNYTVASNNSVTVQNSYVAATTFYSMATGFNSNYDPATKKFTVKWGYNYGAGGAFDAANTREWTQTFTYTGPR